MHLSPGDSVFLAIVGLLAGVMNAVAGGGTFLTFPSVVFTGIPSVPANQTSTIAVFPGRVASFWAYRKILAAQTRTVVILGLTRLLGGAVGAMIVLNTSSLAVVLALRDIAVPFGNRFRQRLGLRVVGASGEIGWSAFHYRRRLQRRLDSPETSSSLGSGICDCRGSGHDYVFLPQNQIARPRLLMRAELICPNVVIINP